MVAGTSAGDLGRKYMLLAGGETRQKHRANALSKTMLLPVLVSSLPLKILQDSGMSESPRHLANKFISFFKDKSSTCLL